MRLALLLASLLSVVELSAQSSVDSTLLNHNTQQPRSEIVAHPTQLSAESGNASASKYIEMLDTWEQSTKSSNVYESKFTRPFSWIGRQLFMRVDWVKSPYTISVNGKEVARVQSSSYPAEVNITKASLEGANIVTITLDKESQVEAIEGWSEKFEGIIGRAYVMTQPVQMVRDIEVSTTPMGEMLYSRIKLYIKSHALNEKTSTIHYSLHSPSGELVTFGHKDINTSMREETSFSINAKTPQGEGWSAESPNLYTLKIRVQYEGRNLEFHNYKLGLRAVEVDKKSGEVKINTTPTTLRMKSVSSTLDPSQVSSIKAEGYNTIRIAAGRYNGALYDACDSIGLYVISPMPINSSSAPHNVTRGGNPSNDPKWMGAYLQRVEAGYRTTQLHPSIIAFSLADDSQNGYNLQESYLKLKEMESSRAIIYFEVDGEWNSDKVEIIKD